MHPILCDAALAGDFAAWGHAQTSPLPRSNPIAKPRKPATSSPPITLPLQRAPRPLTRRPAAPKPSRTTPDAHQPCQHFAC
jgi:hypothetical protein